ncbi:MAG TPA: HAMP domain-containing sensor histidine kinase [Rhizobiaceae bacterium]|nr:HAMP domain-containing sensor histidine kinase [Rhizobiaceae bacterium]
MQPPRPSNPDKNIVDRRKLPRNREVWSAVKRTRNRLATAGGDPRYIRELLVLHAKSIQSAAVAVPALVLVTAIGMLFLGYDRGVLLWSIVATLSYFALAFGARRLDRTPAHEIDADYWRNVLLAGHFLTGLTWSYFAFLHCSSCMPIDVLVAKAIVLLLAMAATAIVSYALNWSTLTAFAFPVLSFAIVALIAGLPLGYGLAVTIAAALGFFSFIARQLNASSVMLFTFRAEKDSLIAELETAKAHSDEARRRAEEANLAKSRFLASMSHELRTPLNAILGFSEVMAKEVLGPMSNASYLDYANDIHRSGAHLLNLINEILDLSRIEAGKHQLIEESVNLLDIAEDCVSMVRLRARNKDIRIEELYEKTLGSLWADERSVRQIILNLLSNAVKFTPRGGEIFVKVGWTASGGQYVSVRDNGPGIPEDEIPVVLSAFGQGSIAIKSAEQGTGLGLPIVQALIHMHGGRFDLRSRLREGTEALAMFPKARVEKATQADAVSQKLKPKVKLKEAV